MRKWPVTWINRLSSALDGLLGNGDKAMRDYQASELLEALACAEPAFPMLVTLFAQTPNGAGRLPTMQVYSKPDGQPQLPFEEKKEEPAPIPPPQPAAEPAPMPALAGEVLYGPDGEKASLAAPERPFVEPPAPLEAPTSLEDQIANASREELESGLAFYAPPEVITPLSVAMLRKYTQIISDLYTKQTTRVASKNLQAIVTLFKVSVKRGAGRKELIESLLLFCKAKWDAATTTASASA